MGRRHHRRGREHRRPPRGAGHGHRPVRGRAVLDRVASRKLACCGLRGVKLVISDAHEGLKVAITRILCATWRRCRVGPLKKSQTIRRCEWRASDAIARSTSRSRLRSWIDSNSL